MQHGFSNKEDRGGFFVRLVWHVLVILFRFLFMLLYTHLTSALTKRCLRHVTTDAIEELHPSS